MIEPRKEVRWFAKQMEWKLTLNDDKTGWLGVVHEQFINEIELRCRRILMHRGNSLANAVDIGNYAMMIADNERKAS